MIRKTEAQSCIEINCANLSLVKTVDHIYLEKKITAMHLKLNIAQ